MSPRLTSTATVSSSAEPASLRREARALVRLFSLLLWLGGGTVLTAIGALLCLPFPPLGRRWRRGQFRLLSSGTAAILGMRIRREGSPPAAPYLMVSNHLSYLDIVAYSAVTPACFVAKREVRGWPIIGPLSMLLGTIFIDRDQKRDALRVLDRLGSALAAGDGAIVFAEATSSDGARVLPFRPALLEWAAQRAYPVYPASITYRVEAAEPPVEHAVCWWGETPFTSHFLGLVRLDRIDATLHFGAEPIADSDRKRLAERLHTAVSATFTPTHTSST
jgi:1-acyl-sn-glycerol-3-phosphate acyltransferase